MTAILDEAIRVGSLTAFLGCLRRHVRDYRPPRTESACAGEDGMKVVCKECGWAGQDTDAYVATVSINATLKVWKCRVCPECYTVLIKRI